MNEHIMPVSLRRALVFIFLFLLVSNVFSQWEYGNVVDIIPINVTGEINPLKNQRANIIIQAGREVDDFRIVILSSSGETVFEKTIGKVYAGQRAVIYWNGKDGERFLDDGVYYVRLVDSASILKELMGNPTIEINNELDEPEISVEEIAASEQIYDVKEMQLAFIKGYTSDIQSQSIMIEDDKTSIRAKLASNTGVKGLNLQFTLNKTYRLYPNKVKLEKLKGLGSPEESVIEKLENLSLKLKENIDKRKAGVFENSLTESEKSALTELIEKGVIYEGNPITIGVSGKLEQGFDFEAAPDEEINAKIVIQESFSFPKELAVVPLKIKIFKQQFLFSEYLSLDNAQRYNYTKLEKEHLPKKIVYGIGQIILDSPKGLTAKTMEVLKIFPAKFINEHFEYIVFAQKFEDKKINKQREDYPKDIYVEMQTVYNELKTMPSSKSDAKYRELESMQVKKEITSQMFRQITKQHPEIFDYSCDWQGHSFGQFAKFIPNYEKEIASLEQNEEQKLASFKTTFETISRHEINEEFWNSLKPQTTQTKTKKRQLSLEIKENIISTHQQDIIIKYRVPEDMPAKINAEYKVGFIISKEKIIEEQLKNKKLPSEVYPASYFLDERMYFKGGADPNEWPEIIWLENQKGGSIFYGHLRRTGFDIEVLKKRELISLLVFPYHGKEKFYLCYIVYGNEQYSSECKSFIIAEEVPLVCGRKYPELKNW